MNDFKWRACFFVFGLVIIAGYYRLLFLSHRFLISIIDSQDNYLVVRDSIMYSKWKGIDGLYPDIIISDCGSRRQLFSLYKIPVDGICELKVQAIRKAVIIFYGLIKVVW